MLNSEDMKKQTTKVSNSCGKGFDTFDEAQRWVDEFILRAYPLALEDLRRKVAICEQQLQDVYARQGASTI